ncbi:MAG: hypothetical protein IJ752_08570 [Alphaproteobacteria bacterium]|nr:hypothetical protein [Alphaproteobacteria bacterium]
MPENQKNNDESDFHRRRKAFVILNGGLLAAPDGFEGSHFDLLCQSGFDENQSQSLIAEQPRGYALEGCRDRIFPVCLLETKTRCCFGFLSFKKAAGWKRTGKFMTACRRAGQALFGYR